MDTADIQKRLDAMAPVAASKGLREPEATFMQRSQNTFTGMVQWREAKDGFNTQWSHHDAETVEEVLDSMDVWIAALPSREEANLRNFMDALGNVIDMGRANGIDVAFVNPLTETMKKLSENALTYQPQAAE